MAAHLFELFGPESELGRWLRAHYGENVSLLQPAIGILGWETNMPMVDHAGLVTEGLYFLDDDHCTPMGQVLARYHPDLILFRADSQPDFSRWGYVQVRFFEGHFTYYLFELAAARPGSPIRTKPAQW